MNGEREKNNNRKEEKTARFGIKSIKKRKVFLLSTVNIACNFYVF